MSTYRLVVEIDVEVTDSTFDEDDLRDNLPDCIEGALARSDREHGSEPYYFPDDGDVTVYTRRSIYLADVADAQRIGLDEWDDVAVRAGLARGESWALQGRRVNHPSVSED